MNTKIQEKQLTQIRSSRRGGKTILSTKILSTPQKELLLNANQNFVEYNALNMEFLSFKIDAEYDYYIFTSQTGVNAFLNNNNGTKLAEKKIFCVGDKTKTLLEQHGTTVIEIAQNSFGLGQIIAKKYKKSSFMVFSGNLRRQELPDILTKNNIRYKELEIYNTHLNYKQFNRNFDGVLFFSPSGVQSFIKKNQLDCSWAFCIGETTASEAKKYTNQIIIANKPTVENVLIKAIKHFNSHLFEKDIN